MSSVLQLFAALGAVLRGGLRRFWRTAKPKVLGLAFLGVVGGLVALSIAQYNKAFTSVTMVSLETDRIGNQLGQNADVKIRGLLVGEVRSVRSTGTGAVMRLALKPGMTALIPADVRARILPKTLFGEKFVDLVPASATDATRAIRAGDVIPQDRSTTAIELGRVFDDLVPVLQAVEPSKLNATLTAISTALQGRGDALGDNLVRTDAYFSKFNPAVDDLNTDISKLADLADNLDRAAPDFFRLLTNSSAVSDNLVRDDTKLKAFLQGTSGFSTTLQRVLTRNETDLIRVGKIGRPTLETLRDNGQQIPYLFHGLVQLTPRINDALGGQGPFLRIQAQVVRDRGPYTQKDDCPRYPGAAGPNCPGFQSGQPNGAVTPAAYSGEADPSGTRAEQGVVAGIVATSTGQDALDVSGLADMLFAPVLRGTEVSVS